MKSLGPSASDEYVELMPQIRVDLSDDLYVSVKEHGLSPADLLQAAIQDELRRQELSAETENISLNSSTRSENLLRLPWRKPRHSWVVSVQAALARRQVDRSCPGLGRIEPPERTETGECGTHRSAVARRVLAAKDVTG